MVSYQAHLDRIRAQGQKPEVNPPLGVQSGWDRTNMMELARKEIDTMIRLRQIIQSTKEPILGNRRPRRRRKRHCAWAPILPSRQRQDRHHEPALARL